LTLGDSKCSISGHAREKKLMHISTSVNYVHDANQPD